MEARFRVRHPTCPINQSRRKQRKTQHAHRKRLEKAGQFGVGHVVVNPLDHDRPCLLKLLPSLSFIKDWVV